MFEKEIVIDGKGHLLGRLASVVAKELLSGQKITVVRCEAIEITGSLLRNKMKWARFMRKRHNTNPKRGPFHFRSPARMFWRTVRGMLPHKSHRGQQALMRLKSYEGVPSPTDKMKRMVVPDALKVLHVKPYRKVTLLGRLASESGWKHAELVVKLEQNRIVKAQEFYMEKKAKAVIKAKAEKAADLGDLNSKLGDFGYYVEPTAVGATKALFPSAPSAPAAAPASEE